MTQPVGEREWKTITKNVIKEKEILKVITVNENT